jgi:hypothetical protein
VILAEALSRTASMIRNRTATLAILSAAVASFVLSVVLWFGGSKDTAVFVGLWVPSILAFGAFTLVAVDRRER